jgi:hypothetical protein
MSNLSTVVADVILRVIFRELLEEFLGAMKVLLNKDFRVIVGALCTFFTEAIHIIPAQLANYVFKFTSLPVKAESHIKVGATFEDVSKGAMFSLFALFPHEIRANFKVMTEITLVPISTGAHALKFIAGLDFALIVRMWAII